MEQIIGKRKTGYVQKTETADKTHRQRGIPLTDQETASRGNIPELSPRQKRRKKKKKNPLANNLSSRSQQFVAAAGPPSHRPRSTARLQGKRMSSAIPASPSHRFGSAESVASPRSTLLSSPIIHTTVEYNSSYCLSEVMGCTPSRCLGIVYNRPPLGTLHMTLCLLRYPELRIL